MYNVSMYSIDQYMDISIVTIAKQLRQILPKDDTWKLVVLFIMMLIAGVLEVLGISIILGFVSQISDPTWIASIPWLQPILAWAGISESKDILLWGGGVLFVMFFIKNIYLIFFHYIQAKYAYNRYRYISTNLFSLYMTLPYMFHLQHNSAGLIRNVTEEAKSLVKNILLPFLIISMELVLICSIVSFFMITEPFITVVVVILIGGVGAILLKIIRSKVREYGMTAYADRANMIQYANEGLGGIKEIKILNTTPWFVDKFNTAVDRMVTAEIFKQVIGQSVRPIIETVAVAGMLVISFLLLLQGRDVASIIPILTLFGTATFKLIPSVNRVIGQYNTLRFYSKSLSEIHLDFHTYAEKDTAVELTQSVTPFSFCNEICFNEICFSYNTEGDDILKNVSFTLKKGEILGIVGTSGAGKTTVVDVLLGLLHPKKGSITVDGVDIHENIMGWQQNIGYIPQFIYLSDDTIRRNIAFGVEDSKIDEQALKNAIALAQLSEFVAELPNGLDTLVGENGTNISGGQRQRIGIARALYHNPQVLVMDEATSALDMETERDIIKAIELLRNKHTIIIITHRMSTVEKTDLLVVLENGAIKEISTYEQLQADNAA